MTSHERAVEVDTLLADIWSAQNKAGDSLRQDMESLHRQDGQRRDPWARRQAWTVSDEDTEASVRAKLLDPASDFHATVASYNDGQPFLIHTGQYAQRTIDDMDAQRALLVTLREQERPLNAEYEADRWPRFFLVMNTGGHIHSSMHCATTFPTTQWAWLPDLSGLTEEDAVASQGPRLCSVCYPSAPVEWTMGLPKAPRCPGSNQRPAAGRERYASQPCSVCGKYYPVSRNTGTIRAHKPQEA